MPNPQGRGVTAVDTNRVLHARYDEPHNAIIFQTPASARPVTLEFPATTLGRQLARGFWLQLPQAGAGGNWASGQTLVSNHDRTLRLMRALERGGCSDIGDVTMRGLQRARERTSLGPFGWRSVRKAVMSALQEFHHEGNSLAAAVAHEMLDSTIENPWSGYPDNVADAIETLARDHFRTWYLAQRRLLDMVGVEVKDRNWILLSADEVLKQLPPPPSAIGPHTALPEQVSHAIRAGQADTAGADARAIDAALWPGTDDLVAGLVVVCLADDTGDNLAVMQTITEASVIHTGRHTAVVHTEKARAATEISVAASTAEFTSYAGVVTALIGLTRFARHWRRRNLDTAEQHLARLAELVFVPHRTDATRLRVVKPSTTAFAQRIKREAGDTLNFHRLRATALKRSVERHGRGGAYLTGQSEPQRRRYLAKMVPEPELAGLVIDAQDNIVERAREYVACMPTATERERQLACTDPRVLVDVGTTTCANRGNDPDTGAACGRGPLACFSCPVGYRTPANIPGLQAAVIFTERLRANDPQEFYEGDAQELHHMSQATLAGFDDDVIAAVDPDRTEQMLPLIGAVYFDLRS